MFVDDTTISAHGKTVLEVYETLRTDINSVDRRCQLNLMLPNVNKTKAIYISELSTKNTNLIIQTLTKNVTLMFISY